LPGKLLRLELRGSWCQPQRTLGSPNVARLNQTVLDSSPSCAWRTPRARLASSADSTPVTWGGEIQACKFLEPRELSIPQCRLPCRKPRLPPSQGEPCFDAAQNIGRPRSPQRTRTGREVFLRNPFKRAYPACPLAAHNQPNHLQDISEHLFSNAAPFRVSPHRPPPLRRPDTAVSPAPISSSVSYAAADD